MEITTHEKTENTENMFVVSLAGRFDAHEADSFKEQMLAKIDGGESNIGVDLAGVNFLDSTALASLTSGMKRCREAGGDLVLMNPSDPVRVILELTRLDRAFSIV